MQLTGTKLCIRACIERSLRHKLIMTEENKDAGKGNFLVVIGREFGSGGRKFGRELADRFGVTFYDKALLAEAASKMGYDPAIIERTDEKRPSFLRAFFGLDYGATTAPAFIPEMSEGIYEAMSHVIKEICSRESCVIVGRTADYVMRHHPRMASVFISAPMETRIRNVAARESMSEDEARSFILKKDKERESFYNYYTNRQWGRASNYHLCLDSTRLDSDMLELAVRRLLDL